MNSYRHIVKIITKKILFALFIIMVIACNKERIISENKLAKIMGEIYLSDQYLKTYQAMNCQADTSLIYQAIFEQNGVTLEEYYASIEYYLSKDKKYPEVVGKALEIIKKELHELESKGSLGNELDVKIPYKAKESATKRFRFQSKYFPAPKRLKYYLLDANSNVREFNPIDIAEDVEVVDEQDVAEEATEDVTEDATTAPADESLDERINEKSGKIVEKKADERINTTIKERNKQLKDKVEKAKKQAKESKEQEDEIEVFELGAEGATETL